MAPYLADAPLGALIQRVLERLQAPGAKADVLRTYIQTVAQLRCAGHGVAPALLAAGSGAVWAADAQLQRLRGRDHTP